MVDFLLTATRPRAVPLLTAGVECRRRGRYAHRPGSALPPWWSTWPFRAFSFAVVLSLAWRGYRYRLHQIANEYNLRLDERVGERTRIARELHNNLLQGFQGLMFRLQAARDLLPNRPAEAIGVLDTTLDRGDHAIAEARDAVQGLRASATMDDDLLQGLTSLGEELAGANESRAWAVFRLLVEGRSRVVTPILRDDIYRIAREALENARARPENRGRSYFL